MYESPNYIYFQNARYKIYLGRSDVTQVLEFFGRLYWSKLYE